MKNVAGRVSVLTPSGIVPVSEEIRKGSNTVPGDP